MQNTSTKYKDLIKQSGRTFQAKIICTLPDSTQITLTDKDIMQNSLKISSATSSEGSFDVGCAVIGELDFEIDNSNGTYTNDSFDGAVFDVRIGLVTEQKYDGTITVEWLRKGIYTAEEITVCEKYISITAYDHMALFDRDFADVNVSCPCTLAKLLQSVCNFCGVSYQSLQFANSGYVVQNKEQIDESTSCRDIISYIAQLACSYAKIDVTGRLVLSWYSDTGIAINERQKLNGSVTVTGVQLTDATADDSVYQLGTTDYCLIMDSNPLVQGDSALYSSIWTERLIGTTLTPFEASVLSDPSIETGDIVTIYDLHGNSYKTPITSLTYQLDGKMHISCDAETINEKQRSKSSLSAKIVAAAKKNTAQQISEYAVRAQQFNELTANSMGFYQTIEEQDDGSQIIYQHDKPNLSESQTIWKKSVDTLSVSTDGGKTYSGFDKDGNAVLQVLAVEGIVADWITTGSLDGNLIKANTVDGKSIKANAITTDKIQAGAVTSSTIAAKAITTDKIAANAVTATEIASQTITATELAAGAVTANKISTGAVTSTKIESGAVTTDKIDVGAIIANKIAANAVTADKIQAEAVTADKIAANTITGDRIKAGAINTDNIATGAITSGKIKANAVTSTSIAANAVTTDKIQANAITADKIATNTITANKIASGAVNTAELAADAVTASKINTGAITADKIAANAVTADKIQANAITADKIAAGAITANTITTGTLKSSNSSNPTSFNLSTGQLISSNSNGAKVRLYNGTLSVSNGTAYSNVVTSNVNGSILTVNDARLDTVYMGSNKLSLKTMTVNGNTIKYVAWE